MPVPPASSQQATPPLGGSAAKLVKEVERGRSGWLDKLYLPAKTHYERRYLNAAHRQQVVNICNIYVRFYSFPEGQDK